jgi:RNA polymerase sigma-70 factor (ECF subfamily)
MAHDDAALTAFLEESYDRAYRTAWLIVRDRADAEEAVQESFLRIWRFRDALPAGDGMRPWLYRVLVNTSVSLLRRERPRTEAAATFARQRSAAADRAPDIVVVDAEAAAAVLAAIGDLPEHLRVPVVLRYWSGLSEREIAAAVRRRPGTVKSRLHEAKRRLAADPRIIDLGPAAAGGTA